MIVSCPERHHSADSVCNGAGVLSIKNGQVWSAGIALAMNALSADKRYRQRRRFGAIAAYGVGLLCILWLVVPNLLQANPALDLDVFTLTDWHTILLGSAVLFGMEVVYFFQSTSATGSFRRIDRNVTPENLNKETLAHTRVTSGWERSSENLKAVVGRAYALAHAQGADQPSIANWWLALWEGQETKELFLRLPVHSSEWEQLWSTWSITEGVTQPFTTGENATILLDSALIAQQSHQGVVQAAHLFAVLSQHRLLTTWWLALKQDPRNALEVVQWGTIRRIVSQNYHHFQRNIQARPHGTMNRTMTATATPFLDALGVDLTAAMRQGLHGQFFGREQEIHDIIRLVESGQRAIVLVGDPGVGKQALCQELARRMIEETVTRAFNGKRLVAVVSSRLVAASHRAGELEQLWQRIFSEAEHAGNVVLLIEQLHQVVGASSSGAVASDILDLIASRVEQGPLIVLATTTPTEFRQVLEQKSTAVNAFHRFEVKPMSADGALEVLESQTQRLEARFHVFATVQALRAVVTLCDRFLKEEMFPEKAITVLQEAMARAGSKQKNTILEVEDVEKVMSERSHVSIQSGSQQMAEKLLHIEDALRQRIVGQEEAVVHVANALRRAGAQLRDQNRPIATFLFIGPTGVGKTALAQQITNVYFQKEYPMIRLDMSEYQQPNSIDRLLGSPGSTTGGVLTERLRTQPYALLLFDELEKAHANILTVLLQLLDAGHVTDAQGRTIDATNTFVVATSNAATALVTEYFNQGKSATEIKTILLSGPLRTIFSPELINRFDDIIIFRPLSKEDVHTIADTMLDGVRQELRDKGIDIQFTPAALDWIAELGYNPDFGVRPLRRAIQDSVESAIARSLIDGTITPGMHVLMDRDGVIQRINP